jgi:AraC family transcriptional regulator
MTEHSGDGEFHGQAEIVRQTHDLQFVEARYAPRARLARHTHELPYFFFVLSGSLTEFSQGRARPSAPGTVIFNPPGISHRDEIGGRGARVFIVQLAHEWTVDRLDGVRDPEWVTMTGDLVSGLALQLRREAQTWDVTSALVVEGILLMLTAEALRTDGGNGVRTPPAWVARAAEQLDANFTSPPTIRELAVDAGVHPAYFARSFRTAFGCTPGAYARLRRLNWARQEVRSSRALVDVALSAGFADQAHFSREFKRGFGITPSEYRRSQSQ